MAARIQNKKTSSEELRQKLKLHAYRARDELKSRHGHAVKQLGEKGIELGRIREHSAKLLGAGALTSTLLLAPPGKLALPPAEEMLSVLTDNSDMQSFPGRQLLVNALTQALPSAVHPLTRDEEKRLERIFSRTLGVETRATLEGEHLNTTYGYIGAEQHLKRYPGDSLSQHGNGRVLSEGIAPGLGAWGYFAGSRQQLTPELDEIERWYAVVQTLYLPEWNTRQPYLRDWYKYRKVLIVNPDNGQAVVAAIADAGPAAWTGKHFGGSPEVMTYLGGDRYKKGRVVVFFVDDPHGSVALGPVEYNDINLAKQ